MQTPRIHAVIVTYHPGAELDAAIAALMPQIAKLTIIDNGSGPETVERLRILTRNPKICVLANPQNRGLADAQNQGIAEALASGADWVLLLDDDSVPAPDMLEQMFSAYGLQPYPERISLLAPRIHDRQIDKTYRVMTGNGWWFSTKAGEQPYIYRDDLIFAIASGSLIKSAVFRKIGGMREAYFIDHIDSEFCARMLKNGYRLMSVGKAILHHSLGNSARVDGIVRKHYPPQRYYTQFRNMLWLVKSCLFSLPAYAALNLGSGLREMVRLVRYEEQKGPKFRAILCGITHGLWRSPGAAVKFS